MDQCQKLGLSKLKSRFFPLSDGGFTAAFTASKSSSASTAFAGNRANAPSSKDHCVNSLEILLLHKLDQIARFVKHNRSAFSLSL